MAEFFGEFVRRSYLAVSPLDNQAVERAWEHNADAITIDLHSVPYHRKDEVSPKIRDWLLPLHKGGAEAFVSISQAYLHRDAEAAVWPGIDGVLLWHPESAADVREADEVLDDLERAHGIDRRTVELVLLLGTAKAVWNIREIITASRRVTTVGLDESHLLKDLHIMPTPEDDPLEFYVRGRLIAEAAGVDETLHGHQGVYRLGIGYPLSSIPRLNATSEEVRQAAKAAKEVGFNGALCLDPSWVKHCNLGFTPTDEEIEYHDDVRSTYAAGVAVGRGAVPFRQGQFVERPTDQIAVKIIALRAQCDQRDSEKAAALAGARRA